MVKLDKAENGVLATEYLETARQMVGMRNRLVHLYWEVDADTLYQALQNNLEDFERFKADVYTYLQDSGVFGNSDR